MHAAPLTHAGPRPAPLRRWAALLGLVCAGCALPGAGPAVAAGTAAPHPCAAKAADDARRLVQLHLGSAAAGGSTAAAAEWRVDIPRPARVLAPQAHPADARRRLQVLELHAFVERGGFRVRLLYAADDRAECLPVGREIVDWTGP